MQVPQAPAELPARIVACELVNRGAVRLTGTLRGQRIVLPQEDEG